MKRINSLTFRLLLIRGMDVRIERGVYIFMPGPYTEKFGIPARAVQKAQGRMPEHMRGMAKQNFYFLCFDQKSMCPN